MPAIRFGHMVMRPILVCIIAAVVLAQPATVGASLGYSSVVLAHKPAAYWRLGDAACCVALDSSPNGRNAIYEGQPLLGQPGAIANDPNT